MAALAPHHNLVPDIARSNNEKQRTAPAITACQQDLRCACSGRTRPPSAHGLQRDRVLVSSVILSIWAELHTQDVRRRSQAFRFSLSVEPA